MTKQDTKLLLKISIAFVLQILSLFFRPFVFIELAYLIALIICDKVENKICYLFFMLPFYNVFRYGVEQSSFDQIFSSVKSVYLSVLLLLCFCAVMFVKLIMDIKSKDKKVSIKSILVWGIFFIAFIIPIRRLNLESLSSLLTITSLFAALFLIWQYNDKWNLKKILDVWFIGIILSVVLYFFKWMCPNLNDFLVVFEKRRFFIQRDPNYWAFELMALLCGYTVLLLKNNEKLRFGIAFVALSVLGVITYSKSFYISYALYLFIMVTMLIVWMVKKAKNKQLNIIWPIVLIGFAVIVGLVLILNIKNILNLISTQRNNVAGEGSFYRKGIKGLINSLTTGRLDIWLEYLGYIVSSPIMFLFGRGVLSGYQSHAVHNTTIQMLYFLGVPTFIALVGIMVILFVKHKDKTSFANYVPLIVLFVFSCSLDLLFSYRTYLILTVMILCLKHNIKTDYELATKPNEILFTEKDFINEDVLLSVIIPVYNVEKYITRCVESLTSQNLIKTEIILIDDGSTDDSGKIIDDLAKSYHNVVAYHKENGGAGSARNFGILKAKGKYLTFVDSDDIVLDNFIEIYNYLKKDYDLIVTGYIAEYSGKLKIVNVKKDKEYYGNAEILKKCLNIESTRNSPCCKVLKKEFLLRNELFFNKGFSEDYNLTGRIMCHVSSMMMSRLCYYYYFAENVGSQMNTYKKSKFEYVLEHSKTILDEAQKVGLNKKAEKKMKQFVAFNILSNFRFVKFLPEDEQTQMYGELKNNWELIKYQKPLYMKLFVLFARFFGFKLSFRLSRFIL